MTTNIQHTTCPAYQELERDGVRVSCSVRRQERQEVHLEGEWKHMPTLFARLYIPATYPNLLRANAPLTTHKDTGTFIEFQGTPTRYRHFHAILDYPHGIREIAYKDTAANKRFFEAFIHNHRRNDPPPFNMLVMLQDVVVKVSPFYERKHVSADEIWFLPHRIYYTGVEHTDTFDGHQIRTTSSYLYSTTPTALTPFKCAMRSSLRWWANLRHGDHTFILNEDMTRTNADDVEEEMFLLGCQQVRLPIRVPVITDTDKREDGLHIRTADMDGTRYYRYNKHISTTPMTALRGSKEDAKFGVPSLDEWVSRQVAFKEELSAKVFHPDRVERMNATYAVEDWMDCV